MKPYLVRFAKKANKAQICEECYEAIQAEKPRVWRVEWFGVKEHCPACGKRQKDWSMGFV